MLYVGLGLVGSAFFLTGGWAVGAFVGGIYLVAKS